MKSYSIITCIFITLISIQFINPSAGDTGYSIDTAVGGNAWGIDRFTKNITCSIEGNVYGFGNFSRHNYVKTVSDLAYSEKTSAVRGGNLSLQEITSFASREGPVSVSYALQSMVDEKGQQSTLNESANISINEAWPFYFASQRMLYYRGKGIKTSEKYDSSGDTISTHSDSWNLQKNSLFIDRNNRTQISIHISPQGIIEDRHSNKKMEYLLDVISTGRQESLDIIKAKPSDERMLRDSEDNVVSRISQEYRGQIKMGLKVLSNDTLPWTDENNSYNMSTNYLPCCCDEYFVEDSQIAILTEPHQSNS